MRKLCAVAVVCVVLAGCGNLLDPAAAVVNGEKITVEEVSADLARFENSPEFERLAGQGDKEALKRQVEQQVLSSLIRRAVLRPKAQEFGIEVTDSEVGDRIEQIKSDFPSGGAFEEALKEQGLTLPQLEELVYDNLLEDELRAEVTTGVGPDEAELREFYEKNRKDFRETRAQHILVEKAADAATIAQQLQAAPARQVERVFKQLAKQHSIDESNSKKAGDLGYFKPGDFVKPFEEAADKLDVGAVSDPVRSEFGFHVIRVTDRRTAPFDDVRAEIEAQLSQGVEDEAWNDYLRQTFEDAEVKVNPRYGEFDIATLQVLDASAEDVPGAAEPTSTPEPTASPPG